MAQLRSLISKVITIAHTILILKACFLWFIRCPHFNSHQTIMIIRPSTKNWCIHVLKDFILNARKLLLCMDFNLIALLVLVVL